MGSAILAKSLQQIRLAKPMLKTRQVDLHLLTGFILQPESLLWHEVPNVAQFEVP